MSHTHPRLHHPPASRRPAARPDHRQPRGADLSDHQLPVQEHGARGQSVRPEGIRQHLHPHHESDDRRAGAAHRQPRRRRRRTGDEQRARGAGAGHPDPLRRGGPHRDQQPALRRHLQPVPLLLPAHRHRCHVRRSDGPGQLRAGDPAQHQDHLRRDVGQPRHQRLPVRRGRGDRSQERDPVDDRQHLRHAVSVPAVRMGGQHHRPQHHQIPGRPRHDHRRDHRGRRQFRLDQRPLRQLHHAGPVLPRAGVRRPGRAGLHPEGAGPNPAGLRRLPGAVQ